MRRSAVAAFFISVSILILTYAASQLFIVKFEKESFLDELEVQARESLSLTKFLFDGMVEDLEHTAEALQKCDDIRDPDARGKLDLSHHLNFCNVTFISDKEGNAYAHNGVEFSIADQGFFQAALASHGLTVSEILPSKWFDAIQIISLPIYLNADQEEIKGYIFGLYDINNFSQSIDAVLNNNEYLYIVDSNGTYINTFVKHQELSDTRNFWDDFAPVEMHGVTLEELKDNFHQHKEGSFSYSYDNVKRYGYHMPLGIKDWQIVFSMEGSVMNSQVKRLSYMATIASIVYWTCMAIMLWSIYSYFTTLNREIRKAHKRIRKNNEIMRIAIESTEHIIFEYNINTRSVDLKTKIPHDLLNNTVTSNVPDGFIDMNAVAACSIADLRNLFEQIRTETSSQADIQLIGDSENPIWYRIALKNIYGDDGQIISTVGSAEDISLLKQGEIAIRRRNALHLSLINTSLLYARLDLSTGIIHEINGKETNQSYLKYVEDIVHRYVCKEHHSYMMQALSLETLWEEYHQEKEYIEVQCKRIENHEFRWTSTLIYLVHESEGANVVFVVRDIDEQKRAELALKEQAEFDGLTGLYNAATTRSKIKEALSVLHTEGEKQIFILLDLDHFKQINDTFGHAAGDQVLIDVAEKLKKHFRSSDIVGRLGGDEFVIMLCDVKSDHYIDTIAGTLSPELVQTYTQGDTSITVSASIGISLSPDDGVTLEDLYKKADSALYKVKKSGRNGYQRWTE